MTPFRGAALFLAVAGAAALVSAEGPAGPAGATSIHLKSISSRVHSKGASLVIETTAPVPYVAPRPDPLTVVLEFRNVAADGVANSVAADAKSPIAGVSIEPGESVGAPTSRVRIALAQVVGHRVRSDRNTVVVDFDKPSAKGTPYVLPPVASAHVTAPVQIPDAMQALAAAQSASQLPAPVAVRVSGVAQQSSAVAQQAPPAQTPPVGQCFGQPGGAGRYTGNPISLDFQGADLRAVLRVFADVSGLNMVIDPKTNGTVDVALRDVPWDQALELILRANGLDCRVDGTIVRIAPREVFTAEDKGRSEAAQAQALAGDLGVLTKTLSYAKGEDLRPLLTKSALSPRGTVEVDLRTNTLIITDLADRLTTANELIGTLDRPQPQVEIEARIVQTSRNYARALGIQWGFMGKVDPALGNTTNLAFPNSGSISGRTGGQQGPSGGATQPTGVNLPAPAATSAVGLALGSVNGAFNLDVALSALESSGNGRILSTPRVTTQNNIAAEMTQGTQIPIQTVANNTVTVQFKDAALILKVTPQITAAGTVIMNISIENSQADFSRAINGIPPINTQRANTSVLVSDNQTTVIGGVYVSQQQASTDKTPGLGQVPLLKWLFRRESNNDQSNELLIFITPRIIKG